jgi:hypothetical protein
VRGDLAAWRMAITSSRKASAELLPVNTGKLAITPLKEDAQLNIRTRHKHYRGEDS